MKGKHLATFIMLLVAGATCLLYFVLTLRTAIVLSALGTMEGDGTFWSEIFGTFLGSVYGSAAIGAWIETIAWAIGGGLLLFASYKAYKSKWGKKRSTFILAIVVIVIVGILSVLPYYGAIL